MTDSGEYLEGKVKKNSKQEREIDLEIEKNIINLK